MIAWQVWLLIPAIGFATAGVLSAMLQFSGGGGIRFPAYRGSSAALALSFAACMFAGPYLAVSILAERWRQGSLTAILAMTMPLIVLLWSFCAGVFVIEILATIGLVAI